MLQEGCLGNLHPKCLHSSRPVAGDSPDSPRGPLPLSLCLSIVLHLHLSEDLESPPLRGAVASSGDHVECLSPNDPQGHTGTEKAGRRHGDCGLARTRGLEGQAWACIPVLGPCNGITPRTGAWSGAARRGQWERRAAFGEEGALGSRGPSPPSLSEGVGTVASLTAESSREADSSHKSK